MLHQSDLTFTKTLLFRDPRNNTTLNILIINANTDFVLDMKRFDVLLF